MAQSNPCARQESFYDKTDFRGHIFQKAFTKNSCIWQCNRILWWRSLIYVSKKKKGCKPYKTPPYHPQSNGLAERMVQTFKNGTESMFSAKRKKIEVFLLRLLLSYRTIPHAGRLESPSALMGRQIRAQLTMSYSTNEKYCTKRTKNQIQKGQNLSCKKARIQLQ